MLTYLQSYETGNLVRFPDNAYGTKEHSSLKIHNGKWYWWANEIGGVSVFDCLIKAKDYEVKYITYKFSIDSDVLVELRDKELHVETVVLLEKKVG